MRRLLVVYWKSTIFKFPLFDHLYITNIVYVFYGGQISLITKLAQVWLKESLSIFLSSEIPFDIDTLSINRIEF